MRTQESVILELSAWQTCLISHLKVPQDLPTCSLSAWKALFPPHSEPSPSRILSPVKIPPSHLTLIPEKAASDPGLNQQRKPKSPEADAGKHGDFKNKEGVTSNQRGKNTGITDYIWKKIELNSYFMWYRKISTEYSENLNVKLIRGS